MELVANVIDGGGGAAMDGGGYSLKASLAQVSVPGTTGLTSGGDYANRLGFYNPPHFTYQNPLTTVVNFNSDSARLSFPPNSVDKEVFDVTINKDPVREPLVADPARINEATQRMVNNEGSWALPTSDNLSEVAIFDEQGYYTNALANKGVLSMRYVDANGDGLVDGSFPPVRVTSLRAWGLDESKNSWVELPANPPDMGSHVITVYFERPGVYAMLGARDMAISRNFKAYPVPFRPNGPNAGSGPGQTGTEADGITFENVPQAGIIEIYTMDGRLVNKLNIPDPLPWPYRVKWDVTTASGGRAASGVYIWRVKADTSVLTGKLMVIW